FARFLRDDPTNTLVASRLLSMLSLRSFALPVGQPLRHDGQVKSARFNQAGSWLVTSSDDGKAKMWDARSTELIRTFTNGSSSISYFSPDGRRVISVCLVGGTRVWDANTGKLLCHPGGGGVFPSGLSSPADKRIATFEPGKVQFVDGETGERI